MITWNSAILAAIIGTLLFCVESTIDNNNRLDALESGKTVVHDTVIVTRAMIEKRFPITVEQADAAWGADTTAIDPCEHTSIFLDCPNCVKIVERDADTTAVDSCDGDEIVRMECWHTPRCNHSPVDQLPDSAYYGVNTAKQRIINGSGCSVWLIWPNDRIHVFTFHDTIYVWLDSANNEKARGR